MAKIATYKIVWIADPALRRPVLPQLEDGAVADEAHEAAVDAAYEAWLGQLRVARERQDWSELTLDGKAPRYLVMRWVPDDVLGWWQDQRRERGGSQGTEESMRFLVRLALHSIEGDKPRTFEVTRNERCDWDVANREALDELKAIVGGGLYPSFLSDLGRQVFEAEARGRPL